MKTGIGGRLALIGIGLAMAGCVESEPGEGQKIGRYRIVSSAEGFLVRESSSWMTRLFETIFGNQPADKLRVGLLPSSTDSGSGANGSSAFRPDQLSKAIVQKRKLKGPAAKPTAMKRPWEVRLLGPSEERLDPFFYFRDQADAERFAAVIDRLLADLRGDSSEDSLGR